jgi:hypothetical protein
LLGAGLAVALTWSASVYDNDPAAFAERARPLLDGRFPYFDYEYEHLPLAIAPMFAAAVIERISPISYTVAFWTVMSGILFGIGALLNRIGRQLGVAHAARRWLLVSWGILPLAAFRVDALSVLLTVATVWYLVEGRGRRSAWAWAGAIAAKGWPVVLVVVDWWRGQRRRAVVAAGATLLGAGVLALFPLFRSGRAFSGVHIETVTGAPVVLARLMRGADHGVSSLAGASYVEVGSWAAVANLALGAGLALYLLLALRRDFTWRRGMDLAGAGTIALMLASPLLSAQFVLWITPFAALSRSPRVRAGVFGVTLLTGAFVTFWYSGYQVWWATIIARNILLVWTGFYWARWVVTESP